MSIDFDSITLKNMLKEKYKPENLEKILGYIRELYDGDDGLRGKALRKALKKKIKEEIPQLVEGDILEPKTLPIIIFG